MVIHKICRVSSRSQSEAGYGVAHQITEIDKYIATNYTNTTETRLYIDNGVSGSADLSKRTALMDAISQLQENDIVIAYDASRIARDLMLQLIIEKEIDKKGATLVYANGMNGDTIEQQLLRNLIGCFNDYARKQSNHKVKLALKEYKSKGFIMGKAPYGYKISEDRREYIEIEEEQYVIGIVQSFTQTDSGKWGFWKRLALHLTDMGIQSRGGKSFTQQSVRITFNKVVKSSKESQNA